MSFEQHEQPNLEIRSFAERAEARAAASEYLADVLEAAAEDPNQQVLLLLSGGSSLEILDKIPENAFGPHLTISTLDDRYTEEAEGNNFAQLMRNPALTEQRQGRVRLKGAVIDTRIQNGEAMPDYLRRLEQEFKNWRTMTKDRGKIIVVQGIGTDGHTASIFPNPKNPGEFRDKFDITNDILVESNAGPGHEYPERITVSLWFLKHEVNESIVYAVGPEKTEILKKILAPNGELAETPARVIREMKKVTLFTDSAL